MTPEEVLKAVLALTEQGYDIEVKLGCHCMTRKGEVRMYGIPLDTFARACRSVAEAREAKP